jgi:hypothetical protein
MGEEAGKPFGDLLTEHIRNGWRRGGDGNSFNPKREKPKKQPFPLPPDQFLSKTNKFREENDERESQNSAMSNWFGQIEKGQHLP